LNIEALQFTRVWLPKVSRSFAASIAQLGSPLELPVGLAYLLCRIADTIEDSTVLNIEDRSQLYIALTAALNHQDRPRHFSIRAKASFSRYEDDESKLMCLSERVIGYYWELEGPEIDIMQRWIGEMISGMARYSHRPIKPRFVILDQEDLEQYCYYVAGTVGGLLSELFIYHEEGIDAEIKGGLMARYESFGLGLQLVNIARDMAQDYRRGWQFIPRSYCADIPEGELLNRGFEKEALSSHLALCDLALKHLKTALEYILYLPPSSSSRRFCSLPLLMAVATLREIRGNNMVLIPDDSVKIEREEVYRLIEFIREHVSSNEALSSCFSDISQRPFLLTKDDLLSSD
jgi:farnesyl-diphosphate farnesyltransferase